MSYLDDASNENESEWVPASASVNVDADDAENQDEFGAQDFRSQMILRDDHEVIFFATHFKNTFDKKPEADSLIEAQDMFVESTGSHHR